MNKSEKLNELLQEIRILSCFKSGGDAVDLSRQLTQLSEKLNEAKKYISASFSQPCDCGGRQTPGHPFNMVTR